MYSKIVRYKTLSVDPRHPAKNRMLFKGLTANDIQILFDSGFRVTNYREMLSDLRNGRFNLGAPIVVPGCDIGDGSLAYVYQTSEISLWVSPDALIRLIAHSLKPSEHRALLDRYGVFYEISSNFYDLVTGEALSPLDLPEMLTAQFRLKPLGDEGHSARNRVVFSDLVPGDIQILFDAGYCLSNRKDLLNDLTLGQLQLGSPLNVPGCDIGGGNEAYVYQTSQISLWVSPKALIQLVARALSPKSHQALMARYGVFDEIGRSYYELTTGEAINPINLAPSFLISQFGEKGEVV